MFDRGTITERIQLFADIQTSEITLETLRLHERENRADLVNALQALIYSAEHAKFKIETNAWTDGYTGMFGDGGIVEFSREKEETLTDLIKEINWRASSIEDMRNEYNDETCWEAV